MQFLASKIIQYKSHILWEMKTLKEVKYFHKTNLLMILKIKSFKIQV